MVMDRAKTGAAIEIKQQKRGDLVAEEIKRLITEKDLKPGDRLPREVELQQLFLVSKSTIREALKSLEVQGLIKVTTGPSGGGMVVEYRSTARYSSCRTICSSRMYRSTTFTPCVNCSSRSWRRVRCRI